MQNTKSGLQMDRNLAVQAFALQQVYNKDEERRELEMARAFELDMMVADSRLKQISAGDPKRLMSTVSNRFLLSDESRLYHGELMDCKKNGLYHPNTHFRKTWDLITLILIMYTSLATPLVLAFYDFNPYYKTSGRSRRTISAYIDVIVDIWFIFDIYLTFNTAYYLGSHDLLITNKKSVRMHYSKGFFLIDLAAVFPFEPLAALQKLDGNKALSTFSVLKMFKLSRMVRVIRIAKVSKMLSDLEEKYGIDIGIVKSYGTILSSLAYMLILIHFFACITFIVTNSWCYGYQPGNPLPQIADGFSWVELSNVANASPGSQYLWSAFRCMSHFLAIGYGTEAPECTADITVTLISQFLGCILFGVVIGCFVSFKEKVHRTSRLFTQKMNEVLAYCDFYQLPQHVAQSMEDYLRSRYKSKFFDEDAIIAQLNPVLKDDIYEYTRMPYFNANFVFANLRTDVLMKLCEFMKYEMFDTEDVIINEGTILRNIYFLETGRAMLTRLDGSRIIYEQFDMIGDISLLLWSKHKVHGADFSYIYYRSTARITALTSISCWRIDVKDMMSLFDREMSPEEIRKFVDFIEDVTHEFIYDICHFNETGQTLTSIQDQHAAFNGMNKTLGGGAVSKSQENKNMSKARQSLFKGRDDTNSKHRENMVESAKNRFMKTLTKNLDKTAESSSDDRKSKFDRMKAKRMSIFEDDFKGFTVEKSENTQEIDTESEENDNYNPETNLVQKSKFKQSVFPISLKPQSSIFKPDEDISTTALHALEVGAHSGGLTHRDRDPSYLRNRWQSAKKLAGLDVNMLKDKHGMGSEKKEEKKKHDK